MDRKKYYEKNKEKILKKAKQYYIDNSEKIKEASRKRREANPNYCKEYCNQWRKDNTEYAKKYYQSNKNKILNYHKQWVKGNPEKTRIISRRHYTKFYEELKESDKKRHNENKGKEKEQHKKWLKSHPHYYRDWNRKNKEKRKTCYDQNYHNQYNKNKRMNDPKFRLDGNIGWMIWYGLKKKKNNRRWVSLVNYTIKDLTEHLEKRFTPKMNWNNYGNYWVVDHIIPRSAFNYTLPEDIGFKRCWALENLQPLTKEENLKKGNKYEYFCN